MSVIERWTIWPTFVMPSGIVGEVERCCAIDGPNVPPGEKIEVVRASDYQGAVADIDKVMRRLHAIDHRAVDPYPCNICREEAERLGLSTASGGQ